MRWPVELVALALLSGCSLVQPLTVEEDEQWRIVCRVVYAGLGRSTTVYLKLEEPESVRDRVMTVDDQCRITIQSAPRPTD